MSIPLYLYPYFYTLIAMALVLYPYIFTLIPIPLQLYPYFYTLISMALFLYPHFCTLISAPIYLYPYCYILTTISHFYTPIFCTDIPGRDERLKNAFRTQFANAFGTSSSERVRDAFARFERVRCTVRNVFFAFRTSCLYHSIPVLSSTRCNHKR